METYCISCKKNTANKNPRKTLKDSLMFFIKLCCLWQEEIDFH